MKKFLRAAFVGSFGVVVACATGGVGGGDDTTPQDAGGGKDTSVATDSGNTNPDTGGKPDTSMDTCMKAAPSNVCGVDPQCDCGTQTCEVDQIKLDGSSSCVMPGSVPAGGGCTATANQCAVGLTCIWKVCRPYCGATGANNACPTSGTCIQLTDSASKNVPNLLVCSIDCALDNATSCPSGDGCIYRGTPVNATDCYPVGSSSTCSATQPNCSPGNVCAIQTLSDGGMAYKCVAWCNMSSPACGGSLTCQHFGPAVMVGSTEYGYCG